MLFQLRLVRRYRRVSLILPSAISQQIIQRRRWIPALLHSQLAAWCTADRSPAPQPRYVCRIIIHDLLKETIQFQMLPQLLAQETGAELSCPLQADSIHQDARHLRIIVRHPDMRRE